MTTLKELIQLRDAARVKMATQGADSIGIPSTWREFVHQCWIRTTGGMKTFSPYAWQESLANHLTINKPRSLALAKSRQVGASQFLLSYIAWRALYESGFLGVILARTQSDAWQLGRRLRLLLETSPYSSAISENALSHLSFVNRSSIILRSHHVESTRGLDGVAVLVIDEAAFCPDLAALLEAAIPSQAVAADPVVILASTPNGAAGRYFDLISATLPPGRLEAAVEEVKATAPGFSITQAGGRGYDVVLVHWSSVFKNEAFLEEVRASSGLSEAAIAQEYELSFEVSEEAVFDMVTVREATGGQWEEPEPGQVYRIGVDPASTGADFVAVSVVKLDELSGLYRLVHLYRRRSGSTEVHINRIVDLIEKYRPLDLVCESNAMGSAWIDAIAKLSGTCRVAGFATTASSKPALIGRLQIFLERRQLRIPDSIVIQELLSYRNVEGSMQAASGSHDDTVISLALAMQKCRYLNESSVF